MTFYTCNLQILVFEFTQADIRDNCNEDSLSFYDGIGTSAKKMVSFCERESNGKYLIHSDFWKHLMENALYYAM